VALGLFRGCVGQSEQAVSDRFGVRTREADIAQQMIVQPHQRALAGTAADTAPHRCDHAAAEQAGETGERTCRRPDAVSVLSVVHDAQAPGGASAEAPTRPPLPLTLRHGCDRRSRHVSGDRSARELTPQADPSGIRSDFHRDRGNEHLHLLHFADPAFGQIAGGSVCHAAQDHPGTDTSLCPCRPFGRCDCRRVALQNDFRPAESGYV